MLHQVFVLDLMKKKVRVIVDCLFGWSLMAGVGRCAIRGVLWHVALPQLLSQ